MFTRILVTMGLSTNTWTTIPYVRHLAIKFGAELHFLGLSTEPQQVWDRSLVSYMEKISRALQEENITTKTNFVYGNPAVEVVKYSNKNSIDLVATTSGTGNEVTCTILSSIAKRMGIKTPIPVLTVPSSRLKEPDLYKKIAILKILVPLDCSQVGETILPYIEIMAQKTRSSVMLLHVNTPPFRGVPVMHSDVIRISRSAGKEYVKKVCLRLQNQGIKTDFEVIDGTPVKAILKYAQQHGVDLIALGTRSSTGIENWIFGNVASKLSERTAIPLLTVSHPVSGLIGSPIEEYA